MTTVRLGIIGFGAQGSSYARFLADGRVRDLVVTAVADVDPAREAAAAALAHGASFHADHRSLLASGEVDAVVVCTPHYLHPGIGIDALEHGLHVLVDKPAGVYAAQVAELNEAAAARPGQRFAIMFNQRANPLYRRLKEVVDEGGIGRILRSNWIITTWWRPQAYFDQSAWRATWGGEGGGVLVNQAPHQLDLWQWLCGVPESVVAKAGYGRCRDIAVEDEVTVLADFGGGTTGVLVTTTHDPIGTDRLEIVGDRGRIVVDDSRVATITRLNAPEREVSAALSAEDVGLLLSGRYDTAGLSTTERIESASVWGEQHTAVLQDFADSILHGTPLLAPGAEGILGVRLANAIHYSSWTGREVPLDLDEGVFLAALNERIREEGAFPERS
ncbi:MULTISPECIES: Gfo/Idh/MocA family protein [unclassified Rathayibacter]|uniref:Gfo/Idh/MocA family protein n=1 Tax=unclassified Rathayibacter TaxID=2609250 RepID=UPI000CE8272A|nr:MULTISPECIES: Gfo/Idh/MocA family oxidoreductase [unclassified Rathayibacter]PPF10517.1 gfo/Idh/MocA family oxidoreductase [Rathayibacter sp. AY1A5]PPF49819.1 gfo/Idh/MocA family oxidoreductase [Rathayibacter sp. AY1A1]PPG85037.1 gfo/Idh/MocA family oxidoreductase [Rathayibacter sp. AY1H2]PPH03211.1 gfo/Idh/MocA family oxidoreductase [Rathayibacter sp. AY1G9]